MYPALNVYITYAIAFLSQIQPKCYILMVGWLAECPFAEGIFSEGFFYKGLVPNVFFLRKDFSLRGFFPEQKFL